MGAGHLQKGQEVLEAGLLQGSAVSLLRCSTVWSQY